MRAATLSLLAVVALLAGCEPRAPSAAAATVPPPAGAPQAVDRDPAAARARAAACVAELGARWKVEQKKDVGAFSLVVAREKTGEPPERKSCLATMAGAVVTPFGEVVSAERDLDGDGRPDLVLASRVVTPGDDDEFRIEPVVVADRAAGPVVLPVEGYDTNAAWSALVVVGGANASLELRYARNEAGDRQLLGWNGKALASRESTWVRVRCHEMARTDARNCDLLAVARGRAFEKELGPAITVKRVDEFRYDFAGDGSRFFRVAWARGGSGDEDPLPTALMTLHLGASGWEEADLPWFDLNTVVDRDGDGRPELEVSASGVRMADCPPKSPDCTSKAFPFGLITWDGSAFSSSTPRLAAAYAKAKIEARSGACPTDLIDAAGLAYLKARWAGASEADGLARADEVIRGGDPRKCASGAKSKSFAAYRAELAASLDEFLPASAQRPKRRP